MQKVRFKGIMPALITPFDSNGKVKTATVKKMIDDLLDVGVSGFYVAGGTGEGVLLNVAQRKVVAEAAIEANAGRGKVIIHTGSINSDEVMELTRHATTAGADGISSVLPSIYFSYTMDELVDFYRKMADNTDLPILVYANHTGNGVDVNKMIERLLPIENIAGAKDTRGNYFKMWELKQLNNGNINVINGPDDTLLCGLLIGADGGIGTSYGLMPEWFVELYDKFQRGDLSGAKQAQDRINRVLSVLFAWSEGNIIRPAKESLRLSGYDAGCATYPAQEYSRDKLAKFKSEMEAAGYVYPR